MPLEDYEKLLQKYDAIKDQIIEKSHREDDRMIVCYTKIRTDIHGFYQDFEKYEIYNNRVSLEDFENIVLSRYEKWNEDDLIVECSLFQNIVEDMILFRDLSDDEIIGFYRKIKEKIKDKKIHIYYLNTAAIKDNLDIARKERVDDKGNEVWFGMLRNFFDNCPHALRTGLKGEEGLIKHWTHRQELELRICREVFDGNYTVLASKAYDKDELRR